MKEAVLLHRCRVAAKLTDDSTSLQDWSRHRDLVSAQVDFRSGPRLYSGADGELYEDPDDWEDHESWAKCKQAEAEKETSSSKTKFEWTQALDPWLHQIFARIEWAHSITIASANLVEAATSDADPSLTLQQLHSLLTSGQDLGSDYADRVLAAIYVVFSEIGSKPSGKGRPVNPEAASQLRSLMCNGPEDPGEALALFLQEFQKDKPLVKKLHAAITVVDTRLCLNQRGGSSEHVRAQVGPSPVKILGLGRKVLG